MPRADATRRITEHLAQARAPLVLITAPYGSDLTTLLTGAEEHLGTRVELLPTVPIPGALLQRRLTVLENSAVDSRYQAVRHILDAPSAPDPAPGTQRLLAVSNVELLEEESRAVVDLLIREHRVGLVLSCSSDSRLGFRYGRILQSPRGLSVQLPALSAEEAHTLLTEALGTPPTSVLVDYLASVTGSAAQGLHFAVRLATGNGSVSTVGSRSAILRSPGWMDRHVAADVIETLENDLGAEAVDILQHIALDEAPALRDFTAEAQTRDAIFWLVEAGLLTLTGDRVRHSRQHLRRSLVLAPPRLSPPTRPTSSQALHRMANGHQLEPQSALAAAVDHLNQGMLQQAHYLISDLDQDDPAVRCVAASALVASGAHRTALKLLDDDAARGISSLETRALRAFIAGALLGSPRPEDDSLGDVSARLHRFSDYGPQRYLEEFSGLAPQQPSAAAEADDHSGKVFDVERLARCTAAAVDAHAAALNDQPERAQAALAVIAERPWSELPIAAAGWTAERMILAQLMIQPGLDTVQHEWAVESAAERRLLRSLSEQTMVAASELLFGADSTRLLHRLEDIWAQFEAGAPAGGHVSRRLLEALDSAAGGHRSAELLGPPTIVPTALTGTLRYAAADTLVSIGQLLHAPESALPETLERVFKSFCATPGVRRLVLRCLLLRRATRLSTDVLSTVISWARRAGVEDAVLQTADELTATNGVPGRLAPRPVPGHPEFVFCPAPAPSRTVPAAALSGEAVGLLTAREREVAAHLISGTSTEEVARTLGISVRTVQTHVRNIYRKLGVGSRTQLRARATAAQERA